MDSDEPRFTRTGRVKKARKGLRIHECDLCGKVYTRNEHLKRHYLKHSGDSDESGASRRPSKSDSVAGSKTAVQPGPSYTTTVTQQASNQDLNHVTAELVPYDSNLFDFDTFCASFDEFQAQHLNADGFLDSLDLFGHADSDADLQGSHILPTPHMDPSTTPACYIPVADPADRNQVGLQRAVTFPATSSRREAKQPTQGHTMDERSQGLRISLQQAQYLTSGSYNPVACQSRGPATKSSQHYAPGNDATGSDFQDNIPAHAAYRNFKKHGRPPDPEPAEAPKFAYMAPSTIAERQQHSHDLSAWYRMDRALARACLETKHRKAFGQIGDQSDWVRSLRNRGSADGAGSSMVRFLSESGGKLAKGERQSRGSLQNDTGEVQTQVQFSVRRGEGPSPIFDTETLQGEAENARFQGQAEESHVGFEGRRGRLSGTYQGYKKRHRLGPEVIQYRRTLGNDVAREESGSMLEWGHDSGYQSTSEFVRSSDKTAGRQSSAQRGEARSQERLQTDSMANGLQMISLATEALVDGNEGEAASGVLIGELATEAVTNDAMIDVDGLSKVYLKTLLKTEIFNIFFARRRSQALTNTAESVLGSLLYDHGDGPERSAVGRQYRRLQAVCHALELDQSINPPADLNKAVLHSDESRFISELLSLATKAPMRSCLTVAGRSWLLGEKVAFPTFIQAQHDVRMFVYAPLQRATAHTAALRVLKAYDQERSLLHYCPWRDWGRLLAVVVLWCVSSSAPERSNVLNEVVKLRKSMPAGRGWLANDMRSVLDVIAQGPLKL